MKPYTLSQTLLEQRYSTTLTDVLQDLLNDPDAIELFLEFHPELWDDLAEQGYTCLDLGQSPQARDIFSFLVRFDPEEAAYHAALADALRSQRSYLDAAEHYLQTTELAPEVPDAYFFLAEIYMMLKHPEQALGQLEEAASYLPDESHPLADSIHRHMEYAHEAQSQV